MKIIENLSSEDKEFINEYLNSEEHDKLFIRNYSKTLNKEYLTRLNKWLELKFKDKPSYVNKSFYNIKHMLIDTPYFKNFVDFTSTQITKDYERLRSEKDKSFVKLSFSNTLGYVDFSKKIQLLNTQFGLTDEVWNNMMDITFRVKTNIGKGEIFIRTLTNPGNSFHDKNNGDLFINNKKIELKDLRDKNTGQLGIKSEPIFDFFDISKTKNSISKKWMIENNILTTLNIKSKEKFIEFFSREIDKEILEQLVDKIMFDIEYSISSNNVDMFFKILMSLYIIGYAKHDNFDILMFFSKKIKYRCYYITIDLENTLKTYNMLMNQNYIYSNTIGNRLHSKSIEIDSLV